MATIAGCDLFFPLFSPWESHVEYVARACVAALCATHDKHVCLAWDNTFVHLGIVPHINDGLQAKATVVYPRLVCCESRLLPIWTVVLYVF